MLHVRSAMRVDVESDRDVCVAEMRRLTLVSLGAASVALKLAALVAVLPDAVAATEPLVAPAGIVAIS